MHTNVRRGVMKKTMAIVIAVVVVVGGLGAWLLTRKSSSTKNTEQTATTQQSSTLTSDQTASTNTVDIKDFAFSPSTLTVKAGTTVTWTNKDSMPHTVTEDDGLEGPASGNLTTNQTYSFTFSKAGTYHYHCALHSSMTATVVVE